MLDGAGFHSELGVAAEVAVVAVDGDEELGAHKIDEEAQLFLAAVAADVDEAVGTVVEDDVGFAAAEMVDDAEDAFFVAGDDARAENDGVAGINVGVLVVVDSGAAEGTHGLTLGAAYEEHQLVGRVVAHLARIDDEARRDFDIAQILRDFGALHHGAAEDDGLATVFARQFKRDANAVDGRGEAAEEELLPGLRKDLVQAGNDGAFAGGVAGALDVGGILEKGEHAAFAVFGEGVQVESLVVEGREIDFEVAGMNDDADRRFDGEGNAINQRVGDADGLDGERAEGELFFRRNFDELDFVEELVFFELAFNISQREFGGVDGPLELAEDPGQSADVVLKAMGEDDGADVFPVLGEVGDVGHDDVDAQKFRFREHEAGVDHDNVVFPADRQAVHSEFAEAAEGDDF